MKWTIATVAILAVLMTAAAMVLLVLLQWPLPADETMEAHLRHHRPELEVLVGSVLEALAAGEPVPPGTYTPYREKGILRRVELDGWPRPDAEADGAASTPVAIRFHTHVRGIGVGAYGAGLAWLQEPPAKAYVSGNEMMQAARQVEGFIGYRHIEGHWYAFLWEAD